MRRLALPLALLAFLLNPGIACGPSESEPGWTYGEVEMRAAVEGQWQLGLRASDGTPSDLTVQVSESTQKADGGTASRAGKTPFYQLRK